MAFVLESGSAIAGRYRLDRLLGMGGMGQVWSAKHLVTGRGVAVKFLRERGLDSEAQRRLLKEARASCAIKHRGVVPVLDVIESDAGEPALVMDLLEGESLARRLARDGRLSAQEATRILLAVAEALLAAHEAGIVHRDLKPDNVFLTESGETKVLDFGIAKLIHLDADVARSAGTQTGAIIGTPVYMSPEQAFGERDIDERTDVWSLGLILYECLSGVLPTAAENMGQVFKIILTRPIRPLAELAPDVPEALAALVTSMLKRERGERPAGMREVIEVLSLLAGAPPAGSERSSAADPPPASKRIQIDASTHGGHSTTQALAPASPPSRSRRVGAAALLAVALSAGVWLAASRTASVGEPDAPAAQAVDGAQQPSTAAQAMTSSSSSLLEPTAVSASALAVRAEPIAVTASAPPRAIARRPGSTSGRASSPIASAASVPSAPAASTARSTLQGAVANDAPF